MLLLSSPTSGLVQTAHNITNTNGKHLQNKWKHKHINHIKSIDSVFLKRHSYKTLSITVKHQLLYVSWCITPAWYMCTNWEGSSAPSVPPSPSTLHTRHPPVWNLQPTDDRRPHNSQGPNRWATSTEALTAPVWHLFTQLQRSTDPTAKLTITWPQLHLIHLTNI